MKRRRESKDLLAFLGRSLILIPSLTREGKTPVYTLLFLVLALAGLLPWAMNLSRKTYKPPRVLFNWDGNDALRQLEWPATPAKLVRAVLENTREATSTLSVVARRWHVDLLPQHEIGTFYGDHLQETTPTRG